MKQPLSDLYTLGFRGLSSGSTGKIIGIVMLLLFSNRIGFCQSLDEGNVDSLDLKIGQMIMIGIGPKQNITADDPLISDIRNNKAGGILLFEKNISSENSFTTLKNMIGNLQKHARIPLFISIDEEGGQVHRLKEKYGFVAMPSAAYLGKLNNKDSTYFYYNRLANQMNQLGINLNYAPCLDLAVNPKNTVLVKVNRCFSDNVENCVDHSGECIKAHHDNNILTVLKHFPGHGSSSGDSHLGMVDVTATWSFKELQPYIELLEQNKVDAIMTAHIINNRWDSLYPTTLSYNLVNNILRNLLNYQGVIISDDMQMFAVSKNYGFEKSIELAINAGVDILMFGNQVAANEKPVTASLVHGIIKQLVTDGKISKRRINESYTRILKMKTRIQKN
jgi:beta-N-acetylhexosaminidase